MTKYSVFSLKAEAAILKHTTIFNWIFLLLFAVLYHLMKLLGLMKSLRNAVIISLFLLRH